MTPLSPLGIEIQKPRKKRVYSKESLSYGMPVYKFSHHLLAVLVHLAHTAVKWNTNFLTLDVGDKLVNTDDTALMKYEKKFMQKAVSIMYTVFSFKKEHGRCFHPKSLLRQSKSRSLAPRLLSVSITHCVWPVCRICGSCRQQSLWYPPNRSRHRGTRQTWLTLSRPTGSRCR